MNKTNKIINQKQLSRIIATDNYIDAYTLIKRYAEKHSYDNKQKQNIINTLFIYYLKEKANKENCLLENVLGEMITILNDEVIDYILSQDINIDCYVIDMFGWYENLTNILALNIKRPKLMDKFLDKIKQTDKTTFRHRYLGSHTDICRLNIIAKRPIEALEIFNQNDYKLFENIDETSIQQHFLLQNEKNFINEFNSKYHDNLYNILLTINEYYSPNYQNIKKLLIGIIYNKKIKLFNISNLTLIKKMLNKDEYNTFLRYLAYMINDNQIILFSASKNTIKYEPINKVTEKIILPKSKIKHKNTQNK